MLDDRKIDIWHKYVIDSPEMAGASRSDITDWKLIFDADYLPRRPMGSNSTTPIKNNVTFIGSSNTELQQVLVDHTGMRRAIDIRISPTALKEHYDLITGSDYLLLWRSVDPFAESPIKPYYSSKLVDKQNSLVAVKSSEDFLMNFTDDDEYSSFSVHDIMFSELIKRKRFKRITDKELFKLFNQFERHYYPSGKKTNIDQFKIELRRLLRDKPEIIPFTKIKVNTGYVYEYNRIINLTEEE